MVCRDRERQDHPLFLQDLQDPVTGRYLPHCEHEITRVQFYMRHIMDYITEEDYEAAKAICAQP